MPWNSLWPDGSKSVKQNTTPGQQNTTYTETVENNDHFWNIGANEDGYHRKVSLRIYSTTAVGAPTDAPVPAGSNGVIYLKTVAGTVQGFYRNAAGIYQFIPGFLTGTSAITSGGYTTVVAVPDDTYGHIWMWRDVGNTKDVQFGSFFAFGGKVQTVSAGLNVNNTVASDAAYNVLFANGVNASGLNIRAKVASGAQNGNYSYRVHVWGT